MIGIGLRAIERERTIAVDAVFIEPLRIRGVAERHGLARAQRFFARGKKVAAVEGLDQLSTRMYTSLGEIVRGWGKNVFAGGRDSVPWGMFGRLIFPFLLFSAPMITIAPAAVLIARTPPAIWPSDPTPGWSRH